MFVFHSPLSVLVVTYVCSDLTLFQLPSPLPPLLNTSMTSEGIDEDAANEGLLSLLPSSSSVASHPVPSWVTSPSLFSHAISFCSIHYLGFLFLLFLFLTLVCLLLFLSSRTLSFSLTILSTPPPLLPAPTYDLSARSFLNLSETPAFLTRYGIPTNAVQPRLSPVSTSAVALFQQHVQANRLVSNATGNLLILGVVNFGYLDFAFNWLCYVQRLGFTNYLLGCIDAESCVRLRELGLGGHAIELQALFNSSELSACGGTGTFGFRSKCFNVHTQLKIMFALTSLLAGYPTLLSDMDISIIHNPFLFMPLVHACEMQLEHIEWCTGWYYCQPTSFCIRMQVEVLTALQQKPEIDDQKVYNEWIRWHRYQAPDILPQYIFPLKRSLYPNGQRYGLEGAIIQHNNFLYTAGDKRKRVVEQQMLIYHEEATTAQGQLVCNDCVVCKNQTPSAPPLRARWPGPLMVADFTPYTDDAPI